jgi:hypothetical protein
MRPPGRPQREDRSAELEDAPNRRSAWPLARVAWLLGAMGAGLLVGLAVRALGGDDAGFLAIPGLVLAAWWRVADPSACQPQRNGGDDA